MVKKYQTFLKLQWRMIFKTKARFISILVISFIGAAFFAGLRITPTVMTTTADKHLDNQLYANLTLIPTYGVTDEDIKELKKVDGIEKVEGIYYFDAQIKNDRDYDGIVVSSYSENFNTPYITAGKTITNNNQCLVDEMYRLKANIKLGDSISISNDYGEKSFEVIGFVKDVRFMLYHSRGTNSYGNGTSEGFVIIPKEEAKEMALNKDLIELLGHDDFYNQALISVYDADEMNIFSENYDEYINIVEADIEEVMTLRLSDTYNALIKDKVELLEEPLKQYNDGYAAYEEGVKTFESSIKQAELTMINGRMQILEGRKELVKAQSQFTGIDTEITSVIDGFQSKLNLLNEQLQHLKDEMNKEEEEVSSGEVDSVPMTPLTPPSVNGDKDEVIENITNDINQTIDDLIGKVTNIQSTIDDLGKMALGLIELQNAQLALDKAEIELDLGEQTLMLKKEAGQKELDEAKAQLDEAKIQLDEAQELIDQIPAGEFYLLDQNMNEGLVSFKSDSDRIGVIAETFPFMFFLVAALVCLTTMTRMVEEQRSQTGVLRALGYSRLTIIMQYVVYATIPTLLGSLVGYFAGCFLFPFVINYLYCLMMYDVPLNMVYCFDLTLFIQSIGMSVLITLFATLGSCVSELMNVPSVLMRPKAPKLGKRILLEKVTWLWKRLSFNQKVTMRNIFRYKKRFFMSVIGIAGCSGLILTGYGIKYSVTDMSVKQYDELTLYDGSVQYKHSYDMDETKELRDELKLNDDITEILFNHQTNISVTNDSNKTVDTVSIFVPASASKIDRFIVLKDYKTKENLSLNEDGAIVTQKLCEMLDVEVGDTIHITYDNAVYPITVAAINENYIAHTIYMSMDYANQIFDSEVEINGSCFSIDETNEEKEDQIGKQLMKLDHVSSVSFVSKVGGGIINQLESVGLITWLLIGSAGLLAFVVLYNLTNININERLTEIATIKVLGFRNPEVYDYVFRENIMLSIIGTFVGLIFGTFLHHSIMLTVEVDLIMFVRSVKPISYVYAIAYTMIFTMLINRFMRRVLDKVDMVSSLKSIE